MPAANPGFGDLHLGNEELSLGDKQKFISTKYQVPSTKRSNKEAFMRVRPTPKWVSLPIKGEVARSAGRGGLHACR